MKSLLYVFLFNLVGYLSASHLPSDESSPYISPDKRTFFKCLDLILPSDETILKSGAAEIYESIVGRSYFVISQNQHYIDMIRERKDLGLINNNLFEKHQDNFLSLCVMILEDLALLKMENDYQYDNKILEKVVEKLNMILKAHLATKPFERGAFSFPLPNARSRFSEDMRSLEDLTNSVFLIYLDIIKFISKKISGIEKKEVNIDIVTITNDPVLQRIADALRTEILNTDDDIYDCTSFCASLDQNYALTYIAAQLVESYSDNKKVYTTAQINAAIRSINDRGHTLALPQILDQKVLLQLRGLANQLEKIGQKELEVYEAAKRTAEAAKRKAEYKRRKRRNQKANKEAAVASASPQREAVGDVGDTGSSIPSPTLDSQPSGLSEKQPDEDSKTDSEQQNNITSDDESSTSPVQEATPEQGASTKVVVATKKQPKKKKKSKKVSPQETVIARIQANKLLQVGKGTLKLIEKILTAKNTLKWNQEDTSTLFNGFKYWNGTEYVPVTLKSKSGGSHRKYEYLDSLGRSRPIFFCSPHPEAELRGGALESMRNTIIELSKNAGVSQNSPS